MALQKTIALPNGVDATYWKIVNIDLDSVSGKASVVIRGYLSQAARNANVNSGVIMKRFKITIADVDGNLLEQAYAAIKETKESHTSETPVFSDAVNI
jgi:hypothetical protein